MKHIITVAAVTFSAVWGDKELNRERIMGYIEAAAARGADMVVFPEMSLTGYDGDAEPVQDADRMQHIQAETKDGESVRRIAALTKEKGIYAIWGMPERDENDPETVYNAACVCGPEGFIMFYRKRNLPNDEATWATPGRSPVLFDTPWGPVGMGICADVYDFPEYGRYARAKGARLFLNSTAMPASVTPAYPKAAIETLAGACSMYVVTAALYGIDRVSTLMGGSSIVGPANQRAGSRQGIYYYAGLPFDAPNAQENDLVLGTIDLTLTTRSYMDRLWNREDGQWNPEEFIELYTEAKR